ncbi:MAG TPA: copper resistance protein CopC [Xanthobacteraceae bacterium]
MRLTILAALLVSLVGVTGALAHASLIRAEPADGAVVAEPPRALKLIFNEPVAPTIIRLVGPNGERIEPPFATQNSLVTITPPVLAKGTHTLTWRVVSADGHPVGGALVFSVGAPSAQAPPPATETGDAAVAAALWAAKLAIYVGLFIGIGGTFFRAWVAQSEAQQRRDFAQAAISAALAAGIVAAIASVGLQGLDALALPLSALAREEPWPTGLATSYGATAVAALAALGLALVAQRVRSAGLARLFSALALLGAGLALSLSGHAASAEPELIARSAVFLHTVAVGFWVGAFLPLLAALGEGDRGWAALARFTRLIPVSIAILLLAGAVLAFVQLDRLDALWTTSYGVVLSAKLAAAVVLLGLGAANRFVLVPRFAKRGTAAARPLAVSIGSEIALAVVVLGLVAGWRFTPPPRVLVSGEHVFIHFHGDHAMTQIEMAPQRARGANVDVEVLDLQSNPLAIKELTLVLSQPKAGIGPLRRTATSEGGAMWRVADLRIPVAGVWRLRLELLIDDFEKETIEDQVELPRAP